MMSSSPDTKKKKIALPSLLSNFRNAQAAIGRAAAAEELNEREMREIHYPLMGTNGDYPIGTSPAGVGGRMAGSSSNRPQNLQRGPPSSNLSSTLSNFSQRFGNQWRKRKRRKKASGSGATGVPQEFYFAVGCFFIAFPVIFILYILARHSVFGDEGSASGAQVQKHEVPANNIVNPDDEIRGAGFGVDQNFIEGEVTKELKAQVEEGDDSQAALVELGKIDEADENISIGDKSGMSESVNDSLIATKDNNMLEDSAKNLDDARGDSDGKTLASGRQDLKKAEKSSSAELPSTSEGNENANISSSSDNVDVVKEKRSHDKLRSLHMKTKMNEEKAESNLSSDVRENDDVEMEMTVNLRGSHDG
jgi:hypothetical protein